MIKRSILRKNTMANYIGQFYNIFISISIFPIYMNYLGAEAFGLIGFFTMLSAWMMLLDIGLSSTIARQSASLGHTIEGMIELKSILRSVESFFILISFVIIFSILSFNDWITSHWLKIVELDKAEVAYCISLMGGMIGFKWMVGLYKGAINGLEEQVWLNIFGIIINSLKFIGGFLLVKYISQTPNNYFEYQLVIGVIELILINQKVYKLLPKNKNFVLPSIKILKKIMPFALGIAFTSAVWIILTNIDKLLLSNVLHLKEYGYFSLIAIIVSGIFSLSSPIGMAIQPRLTSLISQGKELQMLTLYKKATQFVSVIGFAVSGTVAFFSIELLYAWTGDMEAAKWAGPILLWYALGSGLQMVLAFQYYLQFAHGNLKYHIRGVIIFGFFQIISMIIAIYTYGAIGAGITYFMIQLIFLSFWPAYIHSKFAKGIHKDWILRDVLLVILSTILTLIGFKFLNLDLLSFQRVEIFILLIGIGGVVLLINGIVSSDTREIILKKVSK